MTPRRAMWRFLPVLLALLAIAGIYAFVSERLSLGPRWLTTGLIIALAAPLLVAVRVGQHGLGRSIGLLLLAVVTIAEAASTTVLVDSLLTASQRMGDEPHAVALALLRDAALIWLVNILTFSLWYWEVDGGGPARRHAGDYRSVDLVFPQATLTSPRGDGWIPHYVDYLFLAFTASTAFSPTDTLVLSVRVKLLMMAQALVSLTVLAIIAARAINTL